MTPNLRVFIGLAAVVIMFAFVAWINLGVRYTQLGLEQEVERLTQELSVAGGLPDCGIDLSYLGATTPITRDQKTGLLLQDILRRRDIDGRVIEVAVLGMAEDGHVYVLYGHDDFDLVAWKFAIQLDGDPLCLVGLH